MTSPWMTTEAAARYALFTSDGTPDGAPDLARLHKFLARYRTSIRVGHRGRTVLVDRQSLEAHFTRKASHGRQSAAASTTTQVTARDAAIGVH